MPSLNRQFSNPLVNLGEIGENATMLNFPTRRAWKMKVTQVCSVLNCTALQRTAGALWVWRHCSPARPKRLSAVLQRHQRQHQVVQLRPGIRPQTSNFQTCIQILSQCDLPCSLVEVEVGCAKVGCFSNDHICDPDNLASCDIYAGYTGQLNNLDYTACIEQEYGFCGTEYYQEREPGSFSLTNKTDLMENWQDPVVEVSRTAPPWCTTLRCTGSPDWRALHLGLPPHPRRPLQE